MKADQFGARLRELRIAAGLSQKGLAERAGIGQESISSWETNRRTPSWPNVVALCEALGVDCNEFLEPPADRPPAKRGRPPKATPAPSPAEDLQQTARRPRGRPKKKP